LCLHGLCQRVGSAECRDGVVTNDRGLTDCDDGMNSVRCSETRFVTPPRLAE